jgi:hypothetical protein
MAHDERPDDRDMDRPDEEPASEQADRGYGRDPDDHDPGAHVDYYQGGDRGQRRTGPEGGFEFREDYRRSDDHADQGKSSPRLEAETEPPPPDRENE